MRKIDDSLEYKTAQIKFKNDVLKDEECHKVQSCDGNWSIFKSAFLAFSDYKCPMCETKLDSYSHIDHIEPSSKFPEVKCCCKNYLILCPACNSAFKNDQFPIKDDVPKFVNMYVENKLLINPREDEVLKYFQLHFVKLKSNEKVLYLAPNKGLSTEEKEMAKATIKVYGLGSCADEKMKTKCRLSLNKEHFTNYIRFARAMEQGKDVFEEKLNDEDNSNIKNMGLLSFIAKKQFKIAV